MNAPGARIHELGVHDRSVRVNKIGMGTKRSLVEQYAESVKADIKHKLRVAVNVRVFVMGHGIYRR